MAAKLLKLLKGRRLVKLLLLLVIITVVYMSFQLMTIGILSSHNRVENDAFKRWHQHPIKDAHDGHGKPPHQPNSKSPLKHSTSSTQEHSTSSTQKDSHRKGEQLIKNGQDSWLESHKTETSHTVKVITTSDGDKNPKILARVSSENTDHVAVPRGVLPSQAHLYIPNKNDHFVCLDGKGTIPYGELNDDYCDCVDGSDEPGTSACMSGRFYCKFQLLGTDPTWVWSSKVNDGICDCCDGSDEWKNLPLDSHVKLEDDKKYSGLYQAPCSDRCSELKAENVQHAQVFNEGHKLKRKYIEDGKLIANHDKLYGKEGEFAPLRDQCYEFPTSQYTYSVCPFKQATQKFTNYHSVSIGRHPVWVSRGPEKYTLKLTKGDSSGCPGGASRTTVVDFICGVIDGIISTHEDERCVYKFTFATPAAC